jgi:hypothetical protein
MSEQTQNSQEFNPQEILNNPTLEGLATLVVDSIEMNQGQMQSNIVFSSLVNTIVAVLIDKGLTTEKDFSDKLELSLQEIEQQYNQTLSDFEKQNSEAAESSEDEIPKAPKENNEHDESQ